MKWRIFPLWVAGILLCVGIAITPPSRKASTPA